RAFEVAGAHAFGNGVAHRGADDEVTDALRVRKYVDDGALVAFDRNGLPCVAVIGGAPEATAVADEQRAFGIDRDRVDLSRRVELGLGGIGPIDEAILVRVGVVAAPAALDDERVAVVGEATHIVQRGGFAVWLI